jgi:outer membrane biosynthesis protein TonB
MASTGPAKRSNRASILRWLALALLIHAEIGGVLGVMLYFWAPRQAELEAKRREAAARAEPISVSTVDDATARKIIADLEHQEEKSKQEQVKKEEEAIKAPGQVVDLPRPREERRPDEARFAAEYDSWVEKETKRYGKFDPNSQQRHAGDSDPNKRNTPALTPNPSEYPASPGPLAMRLPSEEKRSQPIRPRSGEIIPNANQSGSEEQLANDPDGAFAHSGGGAPRLHHTTTPLENESGGSPGLYGLVPSEEQIARAVGSGTQDHLEGIDEGNETALNAKRWVYATFFNRIKERVRDHWKPAEEYQRRDPTGKIYGAEDRYTLLQVNLKADGSLSKVWVVHTCGLDFLDDTAVEAFKEAQPFLNPPRKLVEDGHGIVNFGFGFFFEVSGAPRMKLFRYKSM